MYTTKHFKLEELVSKSVFQRFGLQAWQFLDEFMLRTLDQLWDKFGTCTINDWVFGGKMDSCGFRTSDDSTGATFSQHKHGRAADCHFKNHTADEVRQYVLSHPTEFPYITAIETGVSWFHFDTRNCKAIMQFKP